MSDLDARYRDVDSLLEQRARDFPRRAEPTFSNLLDALRDLAGALRDRTDDAAPHRSPDELAASAVFIVGYFRSGTSLLQSLLAAHPDVAVLPGEANWFAGERALHFDEVQSRWIRRLISPDGLPPFWTLGRPWDGGEDLYERFTRTLRSYAAASAQDRDLLGEIAAAYAACRPGTPRLWATKTPGDELRVDDIVAAYPRARFVHIVRDPRATVASIVAFNRARPTFTPMPGAAVEIASSLAAARSNEASLGARRYLVVRYEDLVADPERETRRITTFLGVEWSEKLLAPSLTANSSAADRRTAGAIHQLSARRGSELGRLTDAVVRSFTAGPARAIGYDVPAGSPAVALASRAYLSATLRARALGRALRPSRPT
jgi:Sulfotransferase family